MYAFFCVSDVSLRIRIFLGLLAAFGIWSWCSIGDWFAPVYVVIWQAYQSGQLGPAKKIRIAKKTLQGDMKKIARKFFSCMPIRFNPRFL